MTVKPLVEAFFAWVKEVGTSNRLPKGKTLEGINYCINQEEALKVFLNERSAASACINMRGN